MPLHGVPPASSLMLLAGAGAPKAGRMGLGSPIGVTLKVIPRAAKASKDAQRWADSAAAGQVAPVACGRCRSTADPQLPSHDHQPVASEMCSLLRCNASGQPEQTQSTPGPPRLLTRGGGGKGQSGVPLHGHPASSRVSVGSSPRSKRPPSAWPCPSCHRRCLHGDRSP